MTSKIDQHLRMVLLNAENLFLLAERAMTKKDLELSEDQWQKLTSASFPNKSLSKCRALAEVIQRRNPDIVLLCEVGGRESLENFNHLFLDDKYSPVILEGNSDRHIHVGFLIRKPQRFFWDILSNRYRPIGFRYEKGNTTIESKKQVQIEGDDRSLQATAELKVVSLSPDSERFSRDVAELHLFYSDRERPFCILLLTHLKSRLDPERRDPGGTGRRAAELQSLVEIYTELEAAHGPNGTRIFVAGDFNGNASAHQTDPEFLPLYHRTELQDVFEIMRTPSPQRVTYYQTPRGRPPEGRQIDYFFIPRKYSSALLQGEVLPYLDGFGSPLPPPSSLEARLALPSDHFAVFVELEIPPPRPEAG